MYRVLTSFFMGLNCPKQGSREYAFSPQTRGRAGEGEKEGRSAGAPIGDRHRRRPIAAGNASNQQQSLHTHSLLFVRPCSIEGESTGMHIPSSPFHKI